MDYLSICIPRIESTVSKKYIAISFKNIGKIHRIDIVCSNRGSKKASYFSRLLGNQRETFSRTQGQS